MLWSLFFLASLRIYSAVSLTNRNSSQLLFLWWLVTVKFFRCFKIHFHVFLWVSSESSYEILPCQPHVQLEFANVLVIQWMTVVCNVPLSHLLSLDQLGNKRKGEQLMLELHKLHEWYLNMAVSRHLWRINGEKHFPQSLLYSVLGINNIPYKQWSGRRKLLGFASQLLTQREKTCLMFQTQSIFLPQLFVMYFLMSSSPLLQSAWNWRRGMKWK